jgi:hypothetical protein
MPRKNREESWREDSLSSKNGRDPRPPQDPHVIPIIRSKDSGDRLGNKRLRLNREE